MLEATGVERGDRVATLLPSLPETAAVFIGTYKRGAILLSMSVLYGDEGIEHRLRDSGAKAIVTDTANRHRIPDGLVEKVFVMGGAGQADDVDFDATMERASTDYETVDTAADDPAQLYYSSGTTGLAKGILHAHRYLLGLPRLGRVGVGGRHRAAARPVALRRGRARAGPRGRL